MTKYLITVMDCTDKKMVFQKKIDTYLVCGMDGEKRIIRAAAGGNGADMITIVASAIEQDNKLGRIFKVGYISGMVRADQKRRKDGTN